MPEACSGSVADVLAADAPAADAAGSDALAPGAPAADAPSADAPEPCCCDTSPCTADNDRDKIHQKSVAPASTMLNAYPCTTDKYRGISYQQPTQSHCNHKQQHQP